MTKIVLPVELEAVREAAKRAIAPIKPADASDAPVPDGVPVILPAARLLADARELVLRQAPTGVIWPNDRRIAELAPYLDWIALVALVFPTFKDGRAYSQARLLREHHEFRGELRATGQVLRDQLLFLHRAGFDVFEVTKDKDAAVFAEALQRYSVFYQPTGDGRPSTLKTRLAQGKLATARERREVVR